MKKVSNKTIANLFRNAIPHITKNGKNTNKEIYICYAISKAAQYTTDSSGWAAREIIRKRIAPCVTLEAWLEDIWGVERSLLIDSYYDPTKALQRHRIAWLKMLVKEFENKK